MHVGIPLRPELRWFSWPPAATGTQATSVTPWHDAVLTTAAPSQPISRWPVAFPCVFLIFMSTHQTFAPWTWSVLPRSGHGFCWQNMVKPCQARGFGTWRLPGISPNPHVWDPLDLSQSHLDLCLKSGGHPKDVLEQFPTMYKVRIPNDTWVWYGLRWDYMEFKADLW